MYGGAAGGGKSDALLMAALQYVDIPGYAALLLRRTYADLALPEAIMDRAHTWLAPFKKNGEIHWDNSEHTYTFKEYGTKLTFGYLQNENDKYRYASAEFQFIGFDELTQFLEPQYTFLFSRLRRKVGVQIPIRMRGATNPGGIGHEFVRDRFITQQPTPGQKVERIFIPASLWDNPHVDQESYVRSLNMLDAVTRQHLLEGNWGASYEGGLFKRGWFKVEDSSPPAWEVQTRCRFWDMASTEPTSANPDPDWTVGFLLLRDISGEYHIDDIIRERKSPLKVERLIKETADKDGKQTLIRMEQEPGSAGAAVIDHYMMNVLPEYDFQGIRPTGDKLQRAKPVSARAEAGHFYIRRASWNNTFYNEVESFTGQDNGIHDDIVDGLSGSYEGILGGSGTATFKQGSIQW